MKFTLETHYGFINVEKKNIFLYVKLFQEISCDATTKIFTNNEYTRLPCYTESMNESHLAYGLVTNGMHSYCECFFGNFATLLCK